MHNIFIRHFGKMYIHNIIIITFSIVLTILIMCLINYHIENELKHIKKIQFNNFLQTCKTGDLVINRWDSIDIGYRIFCKYCHVSVIYKNKNNQSFLIETHPDEFDQDDVNFEFPRKGVNMYPLKERISEFQGTNYFLKLKDNKKIKNFVFNKYKNIPFPTNYRYLFLKNWFCNNLGIKYTKNDNTMYCSELSGHILKDLGILSNNTHLQINNETHKVKINDLSPDSFEFLMENNKSLYYKPLCIKL